MTFTEILTFLHVTAAIVFVGGVIARWVVRLQVDAAKDIASLVSASNAAGRVENLMVIPGNMVVLVLGFMLAAQTDAPILGAIEGSSQNWLLVSNLLLVLGLIMVPAFFLPRGKRYAALLSEAVAAGEITPALRQELASTSMRIAHTLELIGLLVIVALMVTKPI